MIHTKETQTLMEKHTHILNVTYLSQFQKSVSFGTIHSETKGLPMILTLQGSLY